MRIEKDSKVTSNVKVSAWWSVPIMPLEISFIQFYWGDQTDLACLFSISVKNQPRHSVSWIGTGPYGCLGFMFEGLLKQGFCTNLDLSLTNWNVSAFMTTVVTWQWIKSDTGQYFQDLFQIEIISYKALEAWSEYLFSISKIQSHNFTEIKYLHSCQNETLSKYQESKLEFFEEIHRALDSKEILSSDWSLGSFQTLYILLQISWKLQTENCVSSRERGRGNLAKIKIGRGAAASINPKS